MYKKTRAVGKPFLVVFFIGFAVIDADDRNVIIYFTMVIPLGDIVRELRQEKRNFVFKN